ncbi:LysR family transcriptional regulator [Aureimonas altamirensis]|uniref:LysR family transcriptional regulator n=1 Tax=Aureimonas altamirensis TaxID=370622 RepID=UPI0020375506|nr:LysR family transcriptional regulator [Aureimonas altamirensis]MCM2504651.1 LysR family transcriptional regulator [Aureimonas altamirensis]
MPDHLRSMEVFARVVAAGSFSAAGRAMDMSQTMVTKHVAALERRLGVQLLRRTTQRVTPTEAGRRFAESAERILEEIREAEALAAAETIEPQGTLRVSAPLSFGLREFSKVVPAYLSRHDKVRLDVDFNDRLVDILSEGFDMAIRIGRLKDSSLTARRLAPCNVLVCAAPSYIERHGAPRSVGQLPDHNCLGYTLSTVTGAGLWTFGVDGEVPVKVSGNLTASSGDALVLAAIAGLGIVYEPSFIVGDAVRGGQLVPIALDHPPVRLGGVHAVWPATRHPSAKMRAMIDHLVSVWSGTPPWDRELPV